MPNLRSLGKQAEDQAADFLLSLGYTIVTRRFKSRRGEIDIVAIDPAQSQETLVFVEVKMRTQPGQIPENAVGWSKKQHFHQAVKEYFEKTGHPELPARYDVISIDPEGIRHFINDFQAQTKNDYEEP